MRNHRKSCKRCGREGAAHQGAVRYRRSFRSAACHVLQDLEGPVDLHRSSTPVSHQALEICARLATDEVTEHIKLAAMHNNHTLGEMQHAYIGE